MRDRPTHTHTHTLSRTRTHTHACTQVCKAWRRVDGRIKKERQLFLDNVVLIFCSSFWPSIRVKEVVEMVVVDVVVVVVVDDGDIPRASTLLLLLTS